MSESRRCPQCGADLSADVPNAPCPACLIKLGLASWAERAGGEPGQGDAATEAISGRFQPPDPEELAGHFPQLEILELLGVGGMGAVYKARQPGLDRLVALKILPPEVGRDPAFAERFAREARAMARLDHPNIVTIHDSGQADEFYYLVMEFVEGVDLRQMSRTAEFGPQEALAIVPQICEALQYAHDEGIVHRDIKPENILLDNRGRVKIADFGLAKLLGQAPADFTLTGTGQVMGTLHYMAPEQIDRPLEVDHRADIYSLGVVFYEMLTGELPIGRFAPPSEKVQVDVRLDEVVLRALENEPDRRYQQVSEVRTDVEQINSVSMSSPIPAAPAAKMPPTRRSLARRVRLLVTLAVWTGLFSCASAYLVPKAWNDWWPWEYEESGYRHLQPQSGAYRDVRVRAERKRYHWGQHYDRPIFKRPWVGTATIYLAGSDATATLELDSFHEQWRWTPPLERSTWSQSEPQPALVTKWMKAAGIDISKPGAQAEVEALIGLVKDAAGGVLPGGKSPRDHGLSGGTKIGPFIASGLSGGGIFIGEGAVGPLGRYWVGAILILIIWLPGLVIIVRRHRRRLAAAQETEQRYRLGTIGFFAAILCLAGGAVSSVPPWVWLSSSSWDHTAAVGALDNWYGIVCLLAFLTVFVLCFLTDFFSLGRRWQPRAMIAAGTVVVLVTGILFWRLTGPPATVRVAEIQLHGHPQTVALATTVGCSYERELIRGGGFEDMVPKTMEQRSGLGLQLAFALGLVLFVLGCVANRRVRSRPVGAKGVEPKGSGVVSEKTLDSIVSQPEAASLDRERLAVQGPADALMAVAGVALLVAIGVAVWLTLGPNFPLVGQRTKSTLQAMSATHVIYAVFMLTAGLLMRRLRARMLAMLCVTIVGIAVPSILALNVIMEWGHILQWPVLIPQWLGVPVAVWSTIILFRQNVRAAFQTESQQRKREKQSDDIA